MCVDNDQIMMPTAGVKVTVVEAEEGEEEKVALSVH